MDFFNYIYKLCSYIFWYFLRNTFIIVELEAERGTKELVPVSVMVSLSVLAGYIPKAPNLLFRQ